MSSVGNLANQLHSTKRAPKSRGLFASRRNRTVLARLSLAENAHHHRPQRRRSSPSTASATMAAVPDRKTLEGMKRVDLQRLCKVCHHILFVSVLIRSFTYRLFRIMVSEQISNLKPSLIYFFLLLAHLNRPKFLRQNAILHSV